jgi:hypothetical protein
LLELDERELVEPVEGKKNQRRDADVFEVPYDFVVPVDH